MLIIARSSVANIAGQSRQELPDFIDFGRDAEVPTAVVLTLPRQASDCQNQFHSIILVNEF